MKRNQIEATAPEVWFGRRIQIIWELYVNDIVVIIMRCCIMQKSFALINIENTFSVEMGGLIVSILWPHVT